MRLHRAAAIAAAVTMLATTTPATADTRPATNPPPVIFAGDSLTAGVGAPPGHAVSDYYRRHATTTGDVINTGHGGACVIAAGCIYPERLTDTLDPEVLALRPRIVVVEAGHNDLCHVDDATLTAAYVDLDRRVSAAGGRLVVGTILPYGRAWPWPCDEQRRRVNAWLLGSGLGVVDFAAVLDGPGGGLQGRYDSGDGLHPNAAGYAALGRVLVRWMGVAR